MLRVLARRAAAVPLAGSARSLSVLTRGTYDQLAESTMDQLMEQFDALGDRLPEDAMDVTYSNGVINLKVSGKGTFVVNKQPPNLQIWLSSPLTGPKRFDYNSSRRMWEYSHTKEELSRLLQDELSLLLRQPISLTLNLPAVP